MADKHPDRIASLTYTGTAGGLHTPELNGYFLGRTPRVPPLDGRRRRPLRRQPPVRRARPGAVVPLPAAQHAAQPAARGRGRGRPHPHRPGGRAGVGDPDARHRRHRGRPVPARAPPHGRRRCSVARSSCSREPATRPTSRCRRPGTPPTPPSSTAGAERDGRPGARDGRRRAIDPGHADRSRVPPDRDRRRRRGGAGLRRAASRSSASPTCSPTTTWSAPTRRCTQPWTGPYDVAHHVPRAVRAVRLPRRDHVARAGHRHHHPPAAPDGARGQAGRRGRPAHRAAGSGSASASAGTPVEYEALGKDFTDRGRRIEEQIELMRRLWTERVGHPRRRRTTRVTAAGLAPLPVQRPIPIWIGGAVAARLPARRSAGRRLVPAGAARAASSTRPGRSSTQAADEAGRDPATHRHGGPGQLGRRAAPTSVVDHVGRWRAAGATHVSINTMRAGLGDVDDHLAALTTIIEARTRA